MSVTTPPGRQREGSTLDDMSNVSLSASCSSGTAKPLIPGFWKAARPDSSPWNEEFPSASDGCNVRNPEREVGNSRGTHRGLQHEDELSAPLRRMGYSEELVGGLWRTVGTSGSLPSDSLDRKSVV